MIIVISPPIPLANASPILTLPFGNIRFIVIFKDSITINMPKRDIKPSP